MWQLFTLITRFDARLSEQPRSMCENDSLTHLPLEKKMAAISQTIFLNAFSWMTSFVFWLKCHCNLFRSVQLIITQHWFRKWNRRQAIIWTNADTIYWRIYAGLGGKWVKLSSIDMPDDVSWHLPTVQYGFDCVLNSIWHDPHGGLGIKSPDLQLWPHTIYIATPILPSATTD